jgi:hypothetical protein
VITDSSAYHYDTLTFQNNTGSPQCVTATVDASLCGVGTLGLASYAYVGSFTPASLCTNFVAGHNAQIPPGSSGAYSFVVPDGATYIVEVEEYVAGTGCASYSVSVQSCPPVQ